MTEQMTPAATETGSEISGGQNTGNNIWQETQATSTQENGNEGGTAAVSGQESQGSTVTPAMTQQTSAPAPVMLTKDALQEMLSKVAPQQVAQAQPQMSMEEFNKMMNVFSATPEIAQKLGLSPEAAPVLNEILQAVARQAVTMASYQQQLKYQELTQQISPLQQIVQAQQEQVYRQEFFEKHPDLKDYGPLLEAVYTQLKTEGYRGNSKTEVFEKISSRAKDLLAKLPKVATGNGTAQTTAPAKRMSTLSSGGQGGVGNNGSAGEAKSTAKSLFGR